LAQICDVSVGGTRLVVDRPIQPGKMLRLELPGDSEPKVVLACVVRVVPLVNGRWSLGCAFSRELSGADLARFGARPARSPEEDQRSYVRHECTLTASYHRIGEDNALPGTAKVLNVSSSGIGLLLNEALEAGSLINLHLHNSQGALVRTILACVVHSTVRVSGDLVVGCNFIRELGVSELKELL
jgi:hypothetical protein